MSLIKSNKLLFISLLIIGIIVIIIGVIFNPSFIARHLSPDGVLEKPTVIEIYTLDFIAITLGLIISLFSLLKVTKKSIAEKLEAVLLQDKIIYGGFTITFLLFILPFFFPCILRMKYANPIDYNEGFNVIHTARFLHGGMLYSPINDLPITPVGYPPLSFIITGTISSFTGSLLQTGRVISLISLLLVSFLIFKIIINLTSKKIFALFGALLWIALMMQMANGYVGMYDPQMLAHVFSIGAIYFYTKWIDKLTLQKTCILALLCCLGLFTKHLLIAVPISLAITLFFSDRRHFWIFALAGIIIFSLILFGTWLYGGEYFFSNFLEFDRQVSNGKRMGMITCLFFTRLLFVLFLPFIMLLFKKPKKGMFVLIYFLFSFLLGSYVVGGIGVDVNAWFDFFVAAAIIFGLLAAELPKLKVSGKRILVYGVLAFCFSPLLITRHYSKESIDQVLNYDRVKDRLKYVEGEYQKDVRLLRSIEGPSLFEDILLGYDSRKDFLFDSFVGNQLIVSGRIPEKILLDPINERRFSVIVLRVNLEKVIGSVDKNNTLVPTISTNTRWTDNILKAIYKNYKPLLNLNRPSKNYFYLEDYFYNYFYLPKMQINDN